MSAAKKPISLVIADDHPVVLRGLRELTAGRGFHVVAYCENGIECLDNIRRYRPEMALIDIAMPGMDGLEVAARVRGEKIPTRIVILTASRQDYDLASAAESGASGIVLKDVSSEELIRCLREVHAGKTYFPQSALDDALAREGQRRATEGLIDRALTDRERDLVRLIAENKSNKEIARDLSLTEGTVKVHLHNIYSKLGVRSRAALIMLLHSARRR